MICKTCCDPKRTRREKFSLPRAWKPKHFTSSHALLTLCILVGIPISGIQVSSASRSTKSGVKICFLRRPLRPSSQKEISQFNSLLLFVVASLPHILELLPLSILYMHRFSAWVNFVSELGRVWANFSVFISLHLCSKFGCASFSGFHS